MAQTYRCQNPGHLYVKIKANTINTIKILHYKIAKQNQLTSSTLDGPCTSNRAGSWFSTDVLVDLILVDTLGLFSRISSSPSQCLHESAGLKCSISITLKILLIAMSNFNSFSFSISQCTGRLYQETKSTDVPYFVVTMRFS